MTFITDKQTINELELFGKTKNDKSISKLFDYTRSIGGRNRLRHMIENPLSNLNDINERLDILGQFSGFEVNIEIDKTELDFIEHYLAQSNSPTGYSKIDSFTKGLKFRLKQTNEDYIIHRGIKYLIDFLFHIYSFSNDSISSTPQIIVEKQAEIKSYFASSDLSKCLKYKKIVRLSSQTIGKLDYSFRSKDFHFIRKLLDIVYFIDIFQSLDYARKCNNFCIPRFSKIDNYYKAEGLFHPLIDKPVANDIEYSDNHTICFLTGPNMAGKSTFLKSMSISIYLAHLGFPVPASKLETSLFNGILTTINLSDNIKAGYSHFYSEVLRVKNVAEQINKHGNFFIVFDELFRGTNVKDAYEASLAVIQSFSKLNKCLFAISTHIVEIAEKLKVSNSIMYKYFEANLENGTPRYDYLLKNGVTEERIGMYILQKEKIIETIENKNPKKTES